MKNQSLTEGRISSALALFAIPFLISSLLQALYGAADLFVAGRYADSAAVSAIAIGSQVMQTITGIILGLCMGGTVLIGRCMGERRYDKTAKSIGTLCVLMGLLALLLTPIMLLCTDASITLMHTPREAVRDAQLYIFTCVCGIPFIIGYNTVSSIFRGIGDSKTPLLFISAACVINIAADFILVGILRMGAFGAAAATILAQAVSFLASLLYMRRKGFAFPMRPGHFKPSLKLSKDILLVGLPVALQDAMVNVSFLIITAIINTMGLVASAAVGVVEKIIAFAMLPPSAFASAVAAMTAQNIGAGKPGRAKKALLFSIGYSLAFGLCACAVSQIAPQSITAVFSSDAQVVDAAAEYLRTYSIDCILVSFVFCMNSYFCGQGKSFIAMAHSLLATFGVRIPVSYWLSRLPYPSLLKMGLAAPAATLVSLAICTLYFSLEGRRRTAEPLMRARNPESAQARGGT